MECRAISSRCSFMPSSDMSHMRRASAAPTSFSSFSWLAGITEDGLAAAAARAAEAQMFGFEQRHAEAAFGEVQRRGKPGDAAADDAHVAHVLTRERRVRRGRRRARVVVVLLVGLAMVMPATAVRGSARFPAA